MMMSLQLSPAEAAQELLARRAARSNIIDYARAIDIPGAPISDDIDEEDFLRIETTLADHHKLILEGIDETSRTPHGRLMIFAPPGSAKSSYASVVFPSNYLGREAGHRLILASYGDDLARKMGRRTRSIIKQPRYCGIFKTGLTKESSAAQQFTLENGSEYMATGLLSGITGNRANGIIIDDPVKGREDANSETMRNKTWDAYNDDLKTRLVPGGWIVLIQTRWHQNDLAGRLLPDDWKGDSGYFKCKDGMTWRVICLQARCETDTDPLGRQRGEYIWPEWFDREHWAQFESQPVTWPSLYQQIPAPLDGGIFKPGMIKVLDFLPPGLLKKARGWDLGSTTDGDYTAGPLIGELSDGRYIIIDMERERYGPDERDALLVNTAGRDGYDTPVSLPQDPGQAGKSQVLHFVRLLSGFTVHTSPETGDKVTRAEPFASHVNVGNVVMLRGSWNQALIDEMRVFPFGTYDDQIDGCSRAFDELVNGASAAMPFTSVRKN